MKVPNADKAVIDPAKIARYLLDVDHPDGGSKARLLVSLGYPRRIGNYSTPISGACT